MLQVEQKLEALLLVKVFHSVLKLRGPNSFDVQKNMLKYVPAKELN